jgi:hypothetical protein
VRPDHRAQARWTGDTAVAPTRPRQLPAGQGLGALTGASGSDSKAPFAGEVQSNTSNLVALVSCRCLSEVAWASGAQRAMNRRFANSSAKQQIHVLPTPGCTELIDQGRLVLRERISLLELAQVANGR